MQVATRYGIVWVSDKAPYYNNWTGKAIVAAQRGKKMRQKAGR